jgi:Concanavalin A-like lectin/glucanases superfamily
MDREQRTAASGGTTTLAATAASKYAQVVLAKNPIAYWRLGEARGPDALDSTGNGHQGAYQGTPTFRERGAIAGDPDTAVKLDGRRSYVEIPNHEGFSQPTSGNGLTVEAWVRPDVLTFEGETDDPYVFWIGKGEPNQQEWALRFYSATSNDRPNRISAYIFNPEGGLGAGAYFQDRLTAGEWIHVVACYDPGDADTEGAGVHIYKNGVSRLGPPSAGVLYNNPQWQIKPVHGTAPLRLGTRDRKSFLVGGLDEVAIYPRVLLAEEVLENYKAGAGQ